MQHEKLYELLKYRFNDSSLLEQALRHRSSGKNSNERLEFLGDAVLSFVIASELFNRYGDMTEGELTRLRANLVNGDILADLANELTLGEYLQIGYGETISGGSKRKSILADTMEAIIGAIYLDGGYLVINSIILSLFENKLTNSSDISKKDPKTLLQELQQARKLPLPIYTILKITGEVHSRNFVVECHVTGSKPTTGSGTNKRRAERGAAQKMLKKLNCF